MLLLFIVCLFARPHKDQTALDIVTSEEMKELLTSPLKEPEPVTNGDSTNRHLDSGLPMLSHVYFNQRSFSGF